MVSVYKRRFLIFGCDSGLVLKLVLDNLNLHGIIVKVDKGYTVKTINWETMAYRPSLQNSIKTCSERHNLSGFVNCRQLTGSGVQFLE